MAIYIYTILCMDIDYKQQQEQMTKWSKLTFVQYSINLQEFDRSNTVEKIRPDQIQRNWMCFLRVLNNCELFGSHMRRVRVCMIVLWMQIPKKRIHRSPFKLNITSQEPKNTDPFLIITVRKQKSIETTFLSALSFSEIEWMVSVNFEKLSYWVLSVWSLICDVPASEIL